MKNCYICGISNSSWCYRDNTFCSSKCLHQKIIDDNNVDMMILLKIKRQCNNCQKYYTEQCHCEFYKSPQQTKQLKQTELPNRKSQLDVMLSKIFSLIE